MKAINFRNMKIIVAVIVGFGIVGLSSPGLADDMRFEKLWPKVQKEGVLKVGVAAENGYTTGIGTEKPDQTLQRRRLSRSVWSDQSQHSPLLQIQVQRAECEPGK